MGSPIEDLMARVARLEVAAFGAPRGPTTLRPGPELDERRAARVAEHLRVLELSEADPRWGLNRLVRYLREGLGRSGGDADMREAVHRFWAERGR